MESMNGQNVYFQAEKCFYYTEDEAGNRVQKEMQLNKSISGQGAERVVWLNQEEEYTFYCQAERNYDTDEYDFRIKLDKVEIKDITVAQNPTADSFECLNCEGMQLSINFTDGTKLLSEVTDYKYGVGGYIKAFEWEYITYDPRNYIRAYAPLWSIDGEEGHTDIASLNTGSHIAVLRIEEYKDKGESLKYFDIHMEFFKKSGNVSSMTVQNQRTEYTQDFHEVLGEFELLASYNDGTPDETLSIEDREVRQYLMYTVEGENGAEERTTDNIDEYLRNGGSTGKATVTVAYRGSGASYEINIQENPYERMEIKPRRTVYYKDCTCRLGEGAVAFSGDELESAFGITLYRKDGTQEFYDRWYNLPEWGRGWSYGLKKQQDSYKNYYRRIDEFISAGGTAGEQEVEVTYCGMTSSYPVRIEENPYDHIKIARQPEKLTYLHNEYQRLDLRGLVVYAYKHAEETEYDTYSYDAYEEYQRNPEGLTEEQYYIMQNLFLATLGGHDNTSYLELGEHTATVFLMGHKAEYEIEVLEKMAGRLTVLEAPAKLAYYVNSNSKINLDGLVIEVEDLQGNVTRYKYGYYLSEGDEGNEDYGDWREIGGQFSYDSDINWKKPGNYMVSLNYLGVEDSFQVTVLEDPVKELKITKAPDKMSYYQYEAGSIDLSGMEYEVIFKDGTSYSGKAGSHYFEYGGEGFRLSYCWKSTFNGEVKLGQNVIVLTAFGAKVEIEGITVANNPVKSLEVVKNPEKMQYIGRNEEVDLYGMELLVTYIDGSSEKIVISEHTSQKEVGNRYGGFVTAYRSSSWAEEQNLQIYYMNGSCTVLLPKLDFSTLDPVLMEDEGYNHVVLTEEKPYSVHSFTPAETKEYHFFSVGTHNTYVTLYEGNREIDSGYYGGEGDNFRLTHTLQAGKTYYYVSSHYDFGKAAEFYCYLNSTVRSLSELEVKDFEITKSTNNKFYDFESGRIYAYYLRLKETGYRISYANGWETTGVTENKYGTSVSLDGRTLSVKWKYASGNYVEEREDNALVYTYGEKVVEVPVRFGLPSPVESMTVTEHSWKDNGVYEYKAYGMTEMTIDIRFNDGREDETARVEEWFGPNKIAYYNGYALQTKWKEEELRPGEENIIILSYMGKTAEIPIMVLENPVESMQILQLPEKAEYYPFEYGMDVADFDLYGIKIQINYKDGTEQIVEGTEHGDEIEVPGTYKERLSVIAEYDPEDWGCCISYMGCVKWLRYKTKNFKTEDAVALRFEEEKTLAIEDGYQIFSFVAPETGNYRFEYEIEDHDDNWVVIYSSSGRDLGAAKTTYVDYEMTGGKQYYIAAVIDTLSVKEITCSVTRVSDRERENIQSVDLPMESLEAGDWLPDCYFYLNGCNVSKIQWLNDAGNDGIADYGCAHRLKLVLKPYRNYQFTTATSVTVNGKRLATKSLASDGTIIMYYTFPYTKCKVVVPDVEGYELDESQNAEAGVCGYGEDYKFRYTEDPGNVGSRKLIVKAGGKVLVPDADGYYVVESVDGNVTVTAKTDSLQAGEGESGLTFYNKSMEIFDIMIGRRNAKIADNENGEDALPVLESYEDGSGQFFFGWYLDKDDSINGKGTRFTSQSVLLNLAYSLYAKWGSGYFSYIMNNKQINCKILSIDEHNRTKVQVGDGSNKRLRAARASASPAAFMQDMRGTASGVFVIPETIDLKDNADLAKLGVDFTVGEVTAIADNAFAGETGITDISLPKTIEQIGSGAFAGCASLTSVEIPEGVSLIGENVFNGCESLQSVAIPSTVGAIPEGAFQGCANLADVAIAEGVSEIGAGAFQGCGSLATVALPDTIESVDAAAFPANEGLTIICSSQMKESDVVQAIQEATGASVQAVDVDLDCAYDEKQFTFGDKAQTFTAGVSVDGTAAPDREIVWKYPDTTAYGFSVSQDNRSITVTPRRVTSEDESIAIAAVDKETGRPGPCR